MAQEIADILEVADLKGTVTSTALVLVPLRETGYLNDDIHTATANTTRETADLGDALDGYVYYDLFETAVLSDSVIDATTITADARENAKLDDSPTYVVRAIAETLRETAELDDAISVDALYSADLRETAQLNDSPDFLHTRITTLREQARLGDTLREYGIPADLRESAELGDTISSHLVLRADIRETAVLGETLSTIIGHAVDIREAAALGDSISSLIVRTADLRERAYLEDGLDAVITQDPGTIPVDVYPVELADTDAWTANVENWAMSEYRGFPINQRVGDFGFGPGGTYIQGTGEDMSAFLETGVFELSKDLRDTRIMWVWFEGAMSADLKLKASTRNVKEYETSHEYEPWDDVHSDVQKYGYKIGRGLRGRRWTLRLMSQADTTFDLKRLLVARVDTV